MEQIIISYDYGACEAHSTSIFAIIYNCCRNGDFARKGLRLCFIILKISTLTWAYKY
ncbi:hypothetical protein PILCRDRAFT_657376 [Piloderma croceum F 1598]|uniref:Uncharacterized protein n=1 Tax=Piloderma croceum (strain F 1598) TaxID=765440 RepID=A0A0C3AQ56_PILCF|nr:hypothetical protein PILCRDRAFT_657376 [Piloderma croceum F 1598]